MRLGTPDTKIRFFKKYIDLGKFRVQERKEFNKNRHYGKKLEQKILYMKDSLLIDK